MAHFRFSRIIEKTRYRRTLHKPETSQVGAARKDQNIHTVQPSFRKIADFLTVCSHSAELPRRILFDM